MIWQDVLWFWIRKVDRHWNIDSWLERDRRGGEREGVAIICVKRRDEESGVQKQNKTKQ